MKQRSYSIGANNYYNDLSEKMVGNLQEDDNLSDKMDKYSQSWICNNIS